MIQKTTARQKAVCVLLALAMLLGLCACHPSQGDVNKSNEETSKVPDIQLEIEDVPVQYTAEEIAAYAARFTSLTERVIYLTKNLRVDEEIRGDIRAYVAENVLPLLETYQVTVSELEELCLAAETACGAFEEETLLTLEEGIDLLLNFYRNGLTFLGSIRAGGLLYDFTLLWVDYQIQYCDDRYQKYGYKWYLEDANQFRAQREQLVKELGKTAYAEAVGIFFFAFSELESVWKGTASNRNDADLEGEEVLINDAELLMLLQRQADGFCKRTVTARQWQLTAQLLHAWLFADAEVPSDWSTLGQELFMTLQTSDEVAGSLGLVMPQNLRLYAELLRNMESSELTDLRTGEQTLRTVTVCRVLTRTKTSFDEWSAAVSANIRFNGYEQKQAVERAGAWTDYSYYAATTTAADATALYAAITACAEAGDAQSAEAVWCVAEGFLFAHAPYLTYAFVKGLENDRSGEVTQP